MKFSTSITVIMTLLFGLTLSATASASESYYGNPQPKPKSYSYYKRDVQNKAYGYAGAKVKPNYGYSGYVAPAKVYRRNEDGQDDSGANAIVI